MQSLESLERGTPEFQALSPKQQSERRKLLSAILNTVLEDPSALGLSRQKTVRFVSDYLEFHLTGDIDRFTEIIPTKKK